MIFCGNSKRDMDTDRFLELLCNVEKLRTNEQGQAVVIGQRRMQRTHQAEADGLSASV